jgi:hypothetical protein
MIFGRRSGPVKLVLGAVGLVVLLLLGVTIFRLNQKLDVQQSVNEQTLAASHGLVRVNDPLTERLAQLTALTHTANQALDETRALQPQLAQLKAAVAPAADAIATGRAGGEESRRKLTQIQSILVSLQQRVLPLVPSAAAFGDQGQDLLHILQGLNADLTRSIAAAKRINDALPLPG